MASQVFNQLLDDAVKKGVVADRSRNSIIWFRKAAQGLPLTAVSPSRMLSDSQQSRFEYAPRLGNLYMFKYDPKHKVSLPYYDTFPLIFPIQKAQGGFYGLNLHYLHPRLRAVLFDRLQEDFLTNDRFDDTTRMKARYNVLKAASKYRYFEPCLKHYLTKHIKSRFVYIHPKEWEMATFLPSEQFQKQSKQFVWKQTSQQLKNGAGGNAGAGP